MDNKKEAFKAVIREFHENDLPDAVERDLTVPLDTGKVLAVYGPRRSGKSFYFYTLIRKLRNAGVKKERIIYLNFEDDRILPLDVTTLQTLIEAYFELYPESKKENKYFFFDEIQNIEKWEVFVRRVYEKEKAAIFITGSSSKLLNREIATSLRGRTLSYPLYPLNFKEFVRFRGEVPEKHYEYGQQRYRIKKLLDEYLGSGGFPEVILAGNAVVREHILKEYYDLLVYRDLADRFALKNMDLLKDLLKNLFTNITTLFAVHGYHKSVKNLIPSSRETVHEYLGCIRESGYFSLLPKFSYSLKEQRVNPQKIITLDTGLRNRIAFSFSGDTGKLAENIVGAALLQQDKEVYYWKNRREVDFVVHSRGTLELINVSFGPVIDPRESESLKEAGKHLSKVTRRVIVTRDVEKKEQGIEFIPLHKWLLQ